MVARSKRGEIRLSNDLCHFSIVVGDSTDSDPEGPEGDEADMLISDDLVF